MYESLSDLFGQLGKNIIFIGAVFGAIAVIITQTKVYKEFVKRRRIKTCPVSERLQVQLDNTKQLGVQSLGGQIIMICDRALYKGYLTDLQHKWLIENMKLYTDSGGNGVVKDYYDRAIKLPILSYMDEVEERNR